MTGDEVIRAALISHITRQDERISELKQKLVSANGMIWDLSVGVNNLLSLGNEQHKQQYGHLVQLANDYRRNNERNA